MDCLDRHLRVDAIDTHIDPGYPVARAIITHGHADHARAGHGQVLATAETIEIMKLRYAPIAPAISKPSPMVSR